MPFKQLIDGRKMRVVFSKPYFEEVSVDLLGDFNDWRKGVNPLSRAADGSWLITLDLKLNEVYRYGYLVNNYIWHSDPDAEEFVQGPYGEEASMITTTVNQGLTSFWDHFDVGKSTPDTAVSKKILLPFESWYLLGSVFSTGLEKARQCMAELVLLQLSQVDPADEGCFGQENIFSILRGLQSQMQQLPIKVSVDTAVGVDAESIADYAKTHDIDLIVISDDQVQFDDDKNVADALKAIDVCPTHVVHAN